MRYIATRYFGIYQRRAFVRSISPRPTALSTMPYQVSLLRHLILVSRDDSVVQVWSLTPFYSVDFSQSRINVKKCVFNKRTIKAIDLDGVLGPPRLARHTWLCPCISVVPEARHEASRGPLKGAVSAQKALQGSETEKRDGAQGSKVPGHRQEQLTQTLIVRLLKTHFLIVKSQLESS